MDQQIIVNDELNEESTTTTVTVADDGIIRTNNNHTSPTLARNSDADNDADLMLEGGHQNEVTDNDCKNDEDEGEEEDEESDDYEYTYEDEEDSHFTGFLQQPSSDLIYNAARTVSSGVKIKSCDNDDCAVVPDTTSTSGNSNSVKESTMMTSIDLPHPATHLTVSEATAAADDDNKAIMKPSQWKEPSRAAVNMSLRAERETSGGKRRLAQDLYKIMMGDTTEQGFSLTPSNEDSMDKWKIVLFGFDADSNLAKDLKLIGMDGVELEMSFPEQYPFSPPFVRVTRPKFKRQTGFVMNGALCMELLTSEGWNPINDIESVIVSIRSLLVVGDGRLEATDAVRASDATMKKRSCSDASSLLPPVKKIRQQSNEKKNVEPAKPLTASQIGSYSAAEARQAYSHLSDYHKKKGWDSSGWWAKKG